LLLNQWRTYFKKSVGESCIELPHIWNALTLFQDWSNMEPRSQHQEMEDFLAYKERQASLKAMQEK
uniref:PDEase domain-containing protein n=1 Tax=Angiostrongylus cantonensis TaxID=6313 RepID=A0A0K0D5V8_ANGCA